MRWGECRSPRFLVLTPDPAPGMDKKLVPSIPARDWDTGRKAQTQFSAATQPWPTHPPSSQACVPAALKPSGDTQSPWAGQGLAHLRREYSSCPWNNQTVHEENKASLTSFPGDNPLQSQGRQVGASTACALGSHALWATRHKLTTRHVSKTEKVCLFPGGV